MPRHRRSQRRPRQGFVVRLRDLLAFGLGAVVGAVIVILIPGFSISLDVTGDPIQSEPDPTIVTTVGEMVSLYDDNVFAADERFLGKRIKITGKVAGIGHDGVTGSNAVSLVGTGPLSFSLVYCLFDDSRRGEFLTLREAQIVTVNGVGGGADPKAGLTIRDCKLVIGPGQD